MKLCGVNFDFQVRATHRYSAEDTDELSFDAGEVIAVVPFEDPEEQVNERATDPTSSPLRLMPR